MSERPSEMKDGQHAYEADPLERELEAAASEAGPPPSADAGAASPTPQAKSQLDPASEEELWAGRASWKCIVPTLAGWLLLTLVLTIGMGVLWTEPTAWKVVLVLCVGLLLVLLARAAWRIWSMSYRLTTQRLFIRRGILTQTVDQTELLRVDDVRLRQTLIQRLLGIGQVEVVSSDRSDTKLVLRDILTPDTVAEHIRRHTRMLQRRTLFMEQL